MHDRLFNLPTKMRKIEELLAILLFLSVSVFLSAQLCLPEQLLRSEDFVPFVLLIPQSAVEKECHCVDVYSTTNHFLKRGEFKKYI